MPIDFVRTIKDDDDIVENAESDDEIDFSSFGEEGIKQTVAWDFKPLISKMTLKEKSSMATVSARIEQKIQERKAAEVNAKNKKKRSKGEEDDEDMEEEEEEEDEDDEDEDLDDEDEEEEEEDEEESEEETNGKKPKAAQNIKAKKAAKPTTEEFFSNTVQQPAVPQKKKKITRNFASLGLSKPLLRATEDLGYPEPTPIQAASIPLIMMGKDVLGCALTGSGKTAAFLLPCLERLLFRAKNATASRVLVLTPTRELALQCQSVLTKLARFTDIRSALIVGGLDSETQQKELRTRPDVIIATPGRLIDHVLNTPSFNLENLDVLILDEADRLLDMGFEDELNEIIKSCPKDRQTLLFSATLTGGVEELARLSLNDPVKVAVDEAYNLNSTLVQEFTKINAHDDKTPAFREACLLALCSRHIGKGTLIFVTHKSQARRMRMVLGLSGLKVGELHGDLTQPERVDALQSFRDGDIDYLIATYVASRGLDIAGVQTVVNFNMPTLLRQYVHRVGRTARAGRQGRAISFVSDGSEKKLLKEVLAKCSNMGAARSRVIDPEAIAACAELIAGMEEDILDLVANEKVDRALMYAEMDTKKAEESLRKETERLANRNTWFQTKDEAKARRQLAKEGGDPKELNGKDKNKKQKGKRGADDEAGGKRKKAKPDQGGEDDEPKDRGEAARAAKRSLRAAKRRGEVDENENARAANKKKGPRKMTNFEKKMKALENEKLGTGKKRSKNQFKSSKRYKRH